MPMQYLVPMPTEEVQKVLGNLTPMQLSEMIEWLGSSAATQFSTVQEAALFIWQTVEANGTQFPPEWREVGKVHLVEMISILGTKYTPLGVAWMELSKLVKERAEYNQEMKAFLEVMDSINDGSTQSPAVGTVFYHPLYGKGVYTRKAHQATKFGGFQKAWIHLLFGEELKKVLLAKLTSEPLPEEDPDDHGHY